MQLRIFDAMNAAHQADYRFSANDMALHDDIRARLSPLVKKTGIYWI